MIKFINKFRIFKRLKEQKELIRAFKDNSDEKWKKTDDLIDELESKVEDINKKIEELKILFELKPKDKRISTAGVPKAQLDAIENKLKEGSSKTV